MRSGTKKNTHKLISTLDIYKKLEVIYKQRDVKLSVINKKLENTHTNYQPALRKNI